MKVISFCKKGNWPKKEEKYSLTLQASERFIRRKNLILDSGEEVFIAMDKVVYLNDSDGLKVDNGDWIKINAAKQKVIEVQTKKHVTQSLISRHLGNRHLPIQIINEKIIRIEYDHVIADMLKNLGAEIYIKEDIFEPELGAYGSHKH